MLTVIRRILVLCEGNHCRSPLAEALLRKAIGHHIEVRSAGLRALVGEPAHEETRRLGAELGLDLEPHRGRQLSLDLILESDLILVMDQAQKQACEALVPSFRGRVFLLGHWLAPAGQAPTSAALAGQAIADPISGGPAAHWAACDHIQGAIQSWLPRLAPRNP
ncbi:low molecular weight protein-tyrosine-phosphatase [Geothrix fuzhouensis]|uniref:low molecular weight protein-tyrosine-phosphatase n=1 Tax=Geothrix fuzhouensis TaxID=2966451 RepID=UPI0021474A08|nr:low molecular weight protein-tyrosine-phosphatase [Geothrix fuzhouensis]